MPFSVHRCFPVAFLALTLLGSASPSYLRAQSSESRPTSPPAGRVQQPVRAFRLHNVMPVNESMDIVTALRNMLDPSVRIYLVSAESTIMISGTPDQFALAQGMIDELDAPRKAFRLTYTLTTVDNGQRSGTEHFSMTVVGGQRVDLKQGSKIPVVVSSSKPDAASTETQNTYLDVGVNLDATLEESTSGMRLRCKIERSSVAPEQSPLGVNDPVIRQTVLEGTNLITIGKPVVLGSVDLLGTTRHIDVSVLVEPAP